MKFLVFLGAAISLGFNIPYAVATVRGKVQPNRVSWFLWALAPGIGFFASISRGFTLGEFPVLISTTATLIVLIASFFSRGAYWELKRFDFICGAFSILALIAWGLTHEANVAIVLSLLADLLACLPTLVKAWHHPETEGVAPYLSGTFNAASSFSAMTIWNFTTLAFPIYLLIMNGLLALVIFWRKRQ